MVDAVIKQRDIAVDFVKVIATLLVLNSHMAVCYGSHPELATGGGIGDALFFFVSGFTLFLGRKTDFVNWYKRRLGRIYPTVLAVGLVACLLFHHELYFIEVLSAERYWFLQCILVCYILLYPIVRYSWKLQFCIPVSIAMMLVVFFSLYDFDGQLFYGVNNCFRWFVYFSIMLIGGGVCLNTNSLQYRWWSIPAMLVCVILWYTINYLSKGGNLQIASYIPLVGICVFMYEIGKASWIDKLFSAKFCGNLLFIIGNLCLESYLIQKYIFTDAINDWFPLNIPIIMTAVLCSAYLVHILSGIISQIFDSKPFNWHALLLYKK